VEKQIAIIYLGTSNQLREIPVNKVREFETAYLDYLENKHKDVLDQLRSGKIDDSVTAVLGAAGKEVAKAYRA
jgi:F-type H+-transporting ATPase subunit alpha